MKKSILTTSILLALSFSHYSFADNAKVCDGTNANPCIVQDTKNDSTKINNWRNAKMIRDAYKGNTKGLKHLWVSVSAAPSAGAMKSIEKEVNKLTDGKYKKIIDLDLREESHAFINGNAMSLLTKENWINKGKTHQQAEADEQSWVNDLSSKGSIPNVLTSKQFVAHEFDEGTSIEVKTVQLEKNVAEEAGFEYKRLMVTDHMRPSDSEVDTFVNIVRNTPDKVWIHMHCHGGNGRATSFFAMFDMMKNADRVSFTDIIQRQASVKPYYDLSNIERKKSDMDKYYKERYQFLKHFYQFASDSLKGYQGSWSQWAEENGVK